VLCVNTSNLDSFFTSLFVLNTLSCAVPVVVSVVRNYELYYYVNLGNLSIVNAECTSLCKARLCRVADFGRAAPQSKHAWFHFNTRSPAVLTFHYRRMNSGT
jgi:hypothetical protein